MVRLLTQFTTVIQLLNSPTVLTKHVIQCDYLPLLTLLTLFTIRYDYKCYFQYYNLHNLLYDTVRLFISSPYDILRYTILYTILQYNTITDATYMLLLMLLSLISIFQFLNCVPQFSPHLHGMLSRQFML